MSAAEKPAVVMARVWKLVQELSSKRVDLRREHAARWLVQSAGGEVDVRIREEMTNFPNFTRTGRFRVDVGPITGDYTNDRKSKTRFLPRKDGWPEERLREVAAKIVHGLGVSAAARASSTVLAAAVKAAQKRVKRENLLCTYADSDAPCTVDVVSRNNAVSCTIHLPKLTLDQCIEVAKFVNALIEKP